MAIPEAQLETWCKQGPTGQFTTTYDTIKSALEDYNSPYATRSFTTFLQGSYKNDTNVYGDSDVWPAPGSEDTELGVLMELEVDHGTTEVYAGVQA